MYTQAGGGCACGPLEGFGTTAVKLCQPISRTDERFIVADRGPYLRKLSVREIAEVYASTS